MPLRPPFCSRLRRFSTNCWRRTRLTCAGPRANDADPPFSRTCAGAATTPFAGTPGGGARSAGNQRPRAYVPLAFAPGEAFQLRDDHREGRACPALPQPHAIRARLPRETQEIVFDADDRVFAFFRGAAGGAFTTINASHRKAI
jgi:hypothetical protein